MSTTTETAARTTDESGAGALRVLQEVVLPAKDRLATQPLYMDTRADTGAAVQPEDGARKSSPIVVNVASETAATDALAILDRHRLRVHARATVSFATYFNAFPASYWRHNTHVREVVLRVRTTGRGTVSVYGSNARGESVPVSVHEVAGAEHTTEAVLPLKAFADGGWYWFDLTAADEDLELRGAEWLADGTGIPEGSVTLQITTMNKPSYCLRNARLLFDQRERLPQVREVVIVDQGNQKVVDEPGFREVQERFGERLRVLDQANLGGAGGFARGMYEAVRAGSDYVLLMDDDVEIEPEAVRRISVFADFCKRPTLVGGHMIDLLNPTKIHNFGEEMDPYSFQYGPAGEGVEIGHDFRHSNLRATPWMHRRIEVDYNAWWMCLIPTSVIREIGLALPVFIKWDDVEYGVRAKAAGYRTVSLPGVAVWHLAWADKDDTISWQAYFHKRNQLVAALLHSPFERGGEVLGRNGIKDLRHVLSMQYFAEEARVLALRDVLAGPEALHELLPQRIRDVRRMMTQHSDAVYEADLDAYPAVAPAKPARTRRLSSPHGLKVLTSAATAVVRHLAVSPGAGAQEHPQVHLPYQDARWWRLARYDSALVTASDGTGYTWYKRSPKDARALLTESARLHAQLVLRWPELSRRYREALPAITSLEAWEETFREHSEIGV
ncbi:glycosyl transferase [Kocuria flava]|uniref:Glycosyl transferase n=1 Tax=Kocuria flava TaxID=446860 RepID=A0A0U3HH72_9MICC|nr:glycosyltransferase [Kocuria flava]ALU40521.1 glycosyl transferase [Kocuria flava]GEO92451.1 glycosyl transferase [Kocuria flava]